MGPLVRCYDPGTSNMCATPTFMGPLVREQCGDYVNDAIKCVVENFDVILYIYLDIILVSIIGTSSSPRIKNWKVKLILSF